MSRIRSPRFDSRMAIALKAQDRDLASARSVSWSYVSSSSTPKSRLCMPFGRTYETEIESPCTHFDTSFVTSGFDSRTITPYSDSPTSARLIPKATSHMIRSSESESLAIGFCHAEPSVSDFETREKSLTQCSNRVQTCTFAFKLHQSRRSSSLAPVSVQRGVDSASERCWVKSSNCFL